MSEQALQLMRNRVDNYIETVLTIIAFMNLYLYNKNKKENRKNVNMFQGRRMIREIDEHDLTPDILIQIDENFGVIAEVKISLPLNEERWINTFKQLKSYDTELQHWFTSDEKISKHEIAFLVGTAKSVRVVEYFNQNLAAELKTYSRNFYIIEFDRRDRSQHFIRMRTMLGEPSDFFNIQEELKYGVEMPLTRLLDRYEKTMLYDAKPPTAYLLFIIHHFFLSNRASDLPEFAGVRQNKKIQIETSVHEISTYLNENYSFKKLNSDNTDYQPYIPPKSWIFDAIDAFVALRLAKWTNRSDGLCEISYKRGFIKERFEELCIEHGIDIDSSENQTKLNL